jgi:quercetin dioxygenase-like cupin family protein
MLALVCSNTQLLDLPAAESFTQAGSAAFYLISLPKHYFMDKNNEATPNRPQGSRPIDRQLIQTNLDEAMQQLRSESAWQKNDRNALTLLKNDQMRILIMGLKAGAHLRRHVADGMLSVHLLEGHVTFSTDQQSLELHKGSLISLHPNEPHEVLARQESMLLLTIARIPDSK